MKSREWTLGCYRLGGTTECSGPALLYEEKSHVIEYEAYENSLNDLKAQIYENYKLQKAFDELKMHHSLLVSENIELVKELKFYKFVSEVENSSEK